MTPQERYPRVRRTSVFTLRHCALVLVAGCHDCGDDPPIDHEPDPAVYGVEILPSAVSALKGEPFELRIRLKDAHGHLIRRAVAESVAWTAGPAESVSLTTSRGEAVTILGVAAAPTAWVTATVNGRSERAEITIVSAASNAVDWMSTSHVANEPPRIALLRGRRSGGDGVAWETDALVAGVKEAALGNFQSDLDAGSLILLSRQRRATSVPFVWSDGVDRADLRAVDAKLTIPVTIWILDASQSRAVVDQHVTYAQRVLDQSWAGIYLAVTVMELGIDVDVVVPTTCYASSHPHSIVGRLKDAGVESIAPGMITIAYVSKTYEEPIDDLGLSPGPRGQACRWSPESGSVVVVNAPTAVDNTLAHELGHALGWLNHVSEYDGLDPSNLMWTYHENVPAPRSRLTLGQSLRLTLDNEGSFAQLSGLAAPTALTCPQVGLSDATCPRLNRDVREP